ncbi:serine hydrolase [Oceanobacillus bengalensis]|uniref:Serine hydrolase n=1 Tax=Oceanobacillus bengalensis TaxID=1435466 RepID=A0A494Z079_9BACI|nr:serine hydrolase [Oceanobacillus bengalensis]RKQ15847.1 serine hydrolase [Oceanobacillus bengalensis]
MMQFKQLNLSLQEITSKVPGIFSINMNTPDGRININGGKMRKAASLAKLFILVEAFRQSQDGKLSLEKQIHIEKEHLAYGAGVITYLTGSRVFTYRNLIELMIIVSDNTAANLMMDVVDRHNVNKLAKQIGCTKTVINRKFMDVTAQQVGKENYTSANDVIKLLQLISKRNNILTDHSRTQIMNILSDQQLNHKLPSNIQENHHITFYHKTGELPGVEHDAGIVVNKQKLVEVAVLSEGWVEAGTAQSYISEISKVLIQYMK